MVSNLSVKSMAKNAAETESAIAAATPPASAEPRPGLFRRRAFVVYWAGGLTSNIGTWLQNVTASVVVLALTHSALLVGVLNFATFAPIFLLSVTGGMLSDRFDRRLVVIATQSCSCVVAIAITVLSATGRLTAPILIGLAFLLGTAYALAKPALAAILPSIVERDELGHATAVNTLQFNIGQLGGSALSAGILAVTSPTWAFGLNAASFLGPIAAMLALRRVPFRQVARKAKMRGTGKEGLRFLRQTPGLLAILCAVALSNASVEALRTLAPPFVERSLQLPVERAGLLITAYSAGATVGLLTFNFASRRMSSSRLLALAFALQAAGVVGMAASMTLAPSAIFAVPIGLGFAFNIPALSAGLQLLSPDEYLGRVMSAFSMFHLGIRPLFSLTAGALASVIDVRLALLIFAAFPLLALRLVATTGRALRDSQAAVATAAPPSSVVS
jgi:MFS family permease